MLLSEISLSSRSGTKQQSIHDGRKNPFRLLVWQLSRERSLLLG